MNRIDVKTGAYLQGQEVPKLERVGRHPGIDFRCMKVGYSLVGAVIDLQFISNDGE